MKFAAKIDLELQKQRLYERLDVYFDVESQRTGSAVPQIHAAKLRFAHAIQSNSMPPPPQFEAEAKARGLDMAGLCDLIINTDAMASSGLLALESRRQQLKDLIKTATSEQQLADIGRKL